MKVTGVTAIPVQVPLRTPYVFARGEMSAFENVVVRVETDEGFVGYGESAPSFGIAPQGAIELAQWIEEQATAHLVGADPLDIELLIATLLDVAAPNLDGIAGLDAALWDVMGKAFHQPVYRLLGGLCQDPIPVDYTISSGSPDMMVSSAHEIYRLGYRGVVVKVTGESIAKAISKVEGVRSALPTECTVRVDCNGGFSRSSALTFLKEISHLDIEFVEQPVAADDFDGLRECRATGVAISVDESLNTLDDAIKLVRNDACDIMNIKPPKVGGLLLAKRMAAIADAAGIPVVVGGKTTLEISRAVSRHFAAATCGAKDRAHEGPGPASQELSDDVVVQRTTREDVGAAGSYVHVEHQPGLGIDVVWEKVEHYAMAAIA